MANQQLWHGLAALSGAAAVSLGAYGAHGFKPKNPYFLEARALFTCKYMISGTASWASNVVKKFVLCSVLE